jgi:hypothetical protein
MDMEGNSKTYTSEDSKSFQTAHDDSGLTKAFLKPPRDGNFSIFLQFLLCFCINIQTLGFCKFRSEISNLGGINLNQELG